MTRPDTKHEERRVFELFAQAARLPVVADSIEQPEPAPDIVCTLEGLGRVGFELTRLDAAAELTSKSAWLSTDKLWAQTLAALSAEHSSELRRLYGDADVVLDFVEDAGERRRRAALLALADHLLGLPSGHSGKLRIGSGEKTDIESAEIRRFGHVTDGPIIREFHVGFKLAELSRADRKLSRLDEKLKRGVYSVPDRLELLAYSRWNDPLASDARDFRAYLAPRIPGSRFARAWLFEAMTGAMIAHYP